MILSVCNQKGGTGKTTTAAALVTAAVYEKKKALAVDLDMQGNLSYVMGGNTQNSGIFEALTRQSKITEVIQQTEQGDIITGSINLATIDYSLQGQDRAYILKDLLKPLKTQYDLIVIDTPPTLGILLINALTAADAVIIPMKADMLSLNGLYLLQNSINEAKAKYNPQLQNKGIVLTMHNRRTILAREIEEVISERCKSLGIPLLQTCIREAVAVGEAQTLRQSLFSYAPKSKPAQDYLSLLAEVMQDEN